MKRVGMARSWSFSNVLLGIATELSQRGDRACWNRDDNPEERDHSCRPFRASYRSSQTQGVALGCHLLPPRGIERELSNVDHRSGMAR